MSDTIKVEKGMLTDAVSVSAGERRIFKAFILILLGIIAVGGILTGGYVIGIVSLFFLVIVLSIFRTKQVHDNRYRRDHNMLHGGRITTVVYLEKKHLYGRGEQGSIFRELITTTNPDPIWIPLEEYLALKIENQNIEIFGRMGSGKTTLGLKVLEVTDTTYQRIVFGYKRKDSGRYRKLRYDRWNMLEHRADPWCSKEAFIRALVAAIDLDSSSGITANSIEDLVTGLIKNSNNWEELFVGVKASKSIAVKEKDNVARMALGRIERTLRVIYDPNAKYFMIPRHNIFLDYSQVKNRTISTFDSEFLLELLYDEIIDEKRDRVLIYIDEAHRLLKNRYEQGNNVSIIEDLISREIRDTGSRLVLCTQSYQDVNPTARDQPATQFLFRTQEPNTIAELNSISELLPQAIQDLEPYNFVDIAQDYDGYRVRERVIHFKLYPKDAELVQEQIAATEKLTAQVQAVPTAPPGPPPLLAQQATPPPSDSYLMRVIELLEEEPMTTQEIAAQLVTEKLKPRDAKQDWKPSDEEMNAMKLELTGQRIFIKLLSVHDTEFADVLLIQAEYRDKPISLYFLKDKCEKKVHARLCQIVKEKLLDRKITIINEGKDRIDEVDFEIRGKVIEVETGLRKGNMSDLEERIDKVIKENKNSIIITVPNDRIKEIYKKRFAKREKVNVLVLYELAYYLEGQKAAIATETV